MWQERLELVFVAGEIAPQKTAVGPTQTICHGDFFPRGPFFYDRCLFKREAQDLLCSSHRIAHTRPSITKQRSKSERCALFGC